jgi:hypothetical protein
MDQGKNELRSYCRQCGGERYHTTMAEKTRSWSDDDTGFQGSSTWSIVECGGCHTVTFVDSHWFSEDCYVTEDGRYIPVEHRELYPLAPSRKMPEWGTCLMLSVLSEDDLWISQLHKDIYSAIGMKAYALAAMGARAIVDYVVTSKAGDKGYFKDKLNRMREQNLITETQVDVINAAFAAGSAAAHRGYSPPQADVYTLLDITESLLQQIYIDPARQRRQEKAAAALRANTPPRPKPEAK